MDEKLIFKYDRKETFFTLTKLLPMLSKRRKNSVMTSWPG